MISASNAAISPSGAGVLFERAPGRKGPLIGPRAHRTGLPLRVGATWKSSTDCWRDDPARPRRRKVGQSHCRRTTRSSRGPSGGEALKNGSPHQSEVFPANARLAAAHLSNMLREIFAQRCGIEAGRVGRGARLIRRRISSTREEENGAHWIATSPMVGAPSPNVISRAKLPSIHRPYGRLLVRADAPEGGMDSNSVIDSFPMPTTGWNFRAIFLAE